MVAAESDSPSAIQSSTTAVAGSEPRNSRRSHERVDGLEYLRRDGMMPHLVFCTVTQDASA